MQRIGFIGLGIMGKPMAMNLLRAGHLLNVYARRQSAVEPFIAAGASAYPSPKDLAAVTDIIFTIVGNTADVKEVLLGETGIIHGARPGTIVIDMSTISSSESREIAEQLAAQHIHMLDAPVSGGEQGAINASLSIMVGGKAEILAKVQPLFDILGKQTVHIGDHGAGQVAKACNQIIIAQTIVAVSEALQLASANGVDPAKVRQALLGGFANSKVLEIHGQRMLEHNYKPGFKTHLHQKDLLLALDEARKLGLALPGAAYASQLMNILIGDGNGELDSSAIALMLERLNGVTISQPEIV